MAIVSQSFYLISLYISIANYFIFINSVYIILQNQINEIR